MKFLWILPLTLIKSEHVQLQRIDSDTFPKIERHENQLPLSPTSTCSTLQDAIQLMLSMGVPKENLCTNFEDLVSPCNTSFLLLPPCPVSSRDGPVSGPIHLSSLDILLPTLPQLLPSSSPIPKKHSTRWIRSRRGRYLSTMDDNDEENMNHDQWFYITHATCALACVIIAALAAGLTMGLLSLDPLMLLIKVRAGATKKEQDQAASLLPIVKQHHLLLVTLLLLNSMANEALPLFLEVLVSPIVAVILSVTLVLFFGEIIPSAIFTGPNKMEIASQMVPVVKVVMILLWPLAFPIAKLLDHVLHDGDDHATGGGDVFGRGELSALVRIQYEERMAYKKRRKEERANLRPTTISNHHNSDIIDNLGALDFASLQTIKASKKTVERRHTDSQHSAVIVTQHSGDYDYTILNDNHYKDDRVDDNNDDDDDDDSRISRNHPERPVSIHLDEVSMVEGALSMKTKMALDVYTPIHRMIAIPYDMILTEQNMVDIYSSGFSRVPVFRPNPQKPKSVTAICGVLLTKQLIVVNPNENRPLSTLPLSSPRCVSPKMNLVDLLNLFQTGRLGHLALVCARPEVGQHALEQGKSVPEAAGLMGIITLEDVLEALLQEQIYDESDKYEREANRIARWAAQKWKSHVRRKRRERALISTGVQQWSMGTVVEKAMDANEATSLLGDNSDSSKNIIFDPIGGVVRLWDQITTKKE